MTDLEMVRKCAEAIDLGCYEVRGNNPEHTIRLNGSSQNYWPLTNDVQAMDLVKKLRLHIHADPLTWWVMEPKAMLDSGDHKDLNRAIVECVAAIGGRADGL